MARMPRAELARALCAYEQPAAKSTSDALLACVREILLDDVPVDEDALAAVLDGDDDDALCEPFAVMEAEGGVQRHARALAEVQAALDELSPSWPTLHAKLESLAALAVYPALAGLAADYWTGAASVGARVCEFVGRIAERAAVRAAAAHAGAGSPDSECALDGLSARTYTQLLVERMLHQPAASGLLLPLLLRALEPLPASAALSVSAALQVYIITSYFFL
ncbi:hypothetical protein T492DRAFT_936840 [Pavlovales sp. CCMP2436]|nr:hypothetical protein T492DRAFT_936840 [Pavlovales sp. CCMP2436]